MHRAFTAQERASDIYLHFEMWHEAERALYKTQLCELQPCELQPRLGFASESSISPRVTTHVGDPVKAVGLHAWQILS